MAQSDTRSTIRIGLIAGVIGLSVSAIGMVETFNERDIITGILTLGQLLLFSIPAVVGYLATRSEDGDMRVSAAQLFQGALAGLLSALPLVGLIILYHFLGEYSRFSH